jgi:hypothetical protein
VPFSARSLNRFFSQMACRLRLLLLLLLRLPSTFLPCLVAPYSEWSTCHLLTLSLSLSRNCISRLSRPRRVDFSNRPLDAPIQAAGAHSTSPLPQTVPCSRRVMVGDTSPGLTVSERATPSDDVSSHAHALPFNILVSTLLPSSLRNLYNAHDQHALAQLARQPAPSVLRRDEHVHSPSTRSPSFSIPSLPLAPARGGVAAQRGDRRPRVVSHGRAPGAWRPCPLASHHGATSILTPARASRPSGRGKQPGWHALYNVCPCEALESCVPGWSRAAELPIGRRLGPCPAGQQPLAESPPLQSSSTAVIFFHHS